MEAAHLSALPSTQQRSVAERVAAWHKSGTIERVTRDRGGAGGERLHALEKLIAILLLQYASSNDRNPRCFRDEKDLVEDLGLDRKTFAKYVARLVARGLIQTKRDRADGAMTYYLAPLVAAYREGGPGITQAPEAIASLSERRQLTQRSGNDSLTSRHENLDLDREAVPTDRESFPTGSGNDTTPDRETFPLPLELESLTLSLPQNELQSLARRFGVDPALFEARPNRVAAAVSISQHCAQWGITYRRLRALTKEHGFRAVAGGTGYVIAQLELGRARSSATPSSSRSKSADEPIHNPAALFEAAVARGWSDRLPGLGDDPYLPEQTMVSVDQSLWIALCEEIRTRVSGPTYEATWKAARLLVRSGDHFTIRLPSTFAASIARTQIVPVATQCLRKLGFANAEIEIDVSVEQSS
jgi:hypothetical protein